MVSRRIATTVPRATPRRFTRGCPAVAGSRTNASARWTNRTTTRAGLRGRRGRGVVDEVSRTRQLIAALRDELGGEAPLPPPHAIPEIPAPPARVYSARPQLARKFVDEAAKHTTA